MLTPRQHELLKLAQKGLKIRQIAATAKIDYGTARNELVFLYKRLNAKGRADAVNKAVALGLLKPMSSESIQSASGDKVATPAQERDRHHSLTGALHVFDDSMSIR